MTYPIAFALILSLLAGPALAGPKGGIPTPSSIPAQPTLTDKLQQPALQTPAPSPAPVQTTPSPAGGGTFSGTGAVSPNVTVDNKGNVTGAGVTITVPTK